MNSSFWCEIATSRKKILLAHHYENDDNQDLNVLQECRRSQVGGIDLLIFFFTFLVPETTRTTTTTKNHKINGPID